MRDCFFLWQHTHFLGLESAPEVTIKLNKALGLYEMPKYIERKNLTVLCLRIWTSISILFWWWRKFMNVITNYIQVPTFLGATFLLDWLRWSTLYWFAFINSSQSKIITVTQPKSEKYKFSSSSHWTPSLARFHSCFVQYNYSVSSMVSSVIGWLLN